LLGIDHAANVQACGLEELVRIQLFESGGVNQARFHIAGNRNDGCAFFEGIHQAIKQVGNTRPRGTADHPFSDQQYGTQAPAK
jgi:hypothetical protein